MHSRASMLASLSLLALTIAVPAAAQDATTEDEGNIIIVTATKRDANLQDIPFSINAQTAEDIQKSGAVTLEDLSRNVAGLSVQNLGPGQSQVSVRGVSAGQVVRDQPGVKEQVGVYLDESVISLSLFTPDIDLYDLNRVETLRGPQGTLFGSGSVGGTIRYITNQPKMGVIEGSVEANLNLVDGDDLGGHLKGAINIPMGDNAALRAVGYYTRYGGFINAIGPAGKEDINSGERYGGRLALTFEPTDTFSITPRIVYQKVKADGFNRQDVYNLYANEFTTTRPQVTFDEREQYLLLREGFDDETLIADLNINVGLGGAKLTSVTSYINRDILVSRDASALSGSVSVDLGFPDAGVLLPSNLVDTTDLETWTQEVRLASDNDSPFQWVVGGFYSKVDRVYTQTLPTPGYDAFTNQYFVNACNADPDDCGPGGVPLTAADIANGFGPDSPYNAFLPYDIKQFAIFGEVSYDISDALTATAGGRYYDFKETRSFVSGGLFANGDNRTDSTKSSGFTPRLLLSYDVSDDVTINAQASKGFRLGGVNDPLNLPLCSDEDEALFGGFQDYDDETLWNYELGVKSQGRGFTFNAAGFYNDIKNLQVTLDAGTCSSRVVFNVPKAHSMGVEFELGLQPADGLDLSLSGSLIEAEFDSTLPGVLAATTGIREGNRLPSVPKFQLSAAGSYEWPIGDAASMYVSASFQHVGTRYTQPADQENNPRTFVHGLPFGGAPADAATTVDLQLPDYQLVNLSAGVDFDNGLSLIAYVNNLFDENALLSFDRERGGRARLGYTVGQPRTFGITARKTF
ncbi:TonB-dependent receptor [Sphingopyxis sp. JAI128]|uniref:TonB-dependent receptor n=1 Tax=Sphingopyxis sp. JAI128 TaxID=2723066 RepID=UPI0016231776|nr:TonB-dependent receptor [Sphingopyxis sp. JAI128]MBB6426124.1 outer membrane receptor protein involved in Fe transport [Sphingopyxis sp. JAI128]